MPFSHGLLILQDLESTETHDHWNPSEAGIDIEKDSVYLPVLNYVDGIVNVKIVSGGKPRRDLTSIYNGDMEFRSGQFVARDTVGDISAIFHIDKGISRLSIEVDNEEYASEVIIRFDPDS
ncbi:hypothetical protein [Streptosporangium sp. OZ121]|uniref:hypothetical protein n=1 Tax=Streptosporangium sp. OZ121 TaxID=3444183 RepID=UPI003F795C17